MTSWGETGCIIHQLFVSEFSDHFRPHIKKKLGPSK